MLNNIWLGILIGIVIGRGFDLWVDIKDRRAVTEEKSTASVLPTAEGDGQ
jgi:hypothetical protein